MKIARTGLAAATLFLVAAAAPLPAQTTPTAATTQAIRPPKVLGNLRPGHPRLMALDADIERVRRLIASDPQAKRWHENLIATADKAIGEPPADYKLIGPRLLDQSRKALNRIALFAGLHRIDGGKKYADAARREMLTVAAFPDWNPSHFLDVAEMTNACGIGYDWLYAELSPEDRATIRTAIVDKGLKPALPSLLEGLGWTRNANNWQQVCNGGLTVGALAIAEEEPQLAGRIVELCRNQVREQMMTFLAPDGGCVEGPGYWGYSTVYAAYYLSALRTALDTDFGFVAAPGFSEGGLFRIESIGPTGRTFNYADSGDGAGPAPQMMLFARLFDRPLYAQHERKLVGDRGGIFHLLWAGEGKELPAAEAATRQGSPQASPPLDVLFKGVNVAYFRSAWDDPNGFFVGFKAGDNQASHAHLDLGSFVMDALGQRWAIDLGSDDYNLPGYWDKKQKRWSYYRLSTPGHNTLTIDGQNQAPGGRGAIVGYRSTKDMAYAVADLTRAYPEADRVLSGVGLVGRSRVLVMHDVTPRKPSEVAWQMHTRARVEPLGTTARLAQGGKTLYAHVLSPPDATFEVASVENLPAPNAKNPGVVKLILRTKASSPTRFAVLFDTSEKETPLLPQYLEKWATESPVK